MGCIGGVLGSWGDWGIWKIGSGRFRRIVGGLGGRGQSLGRVDAKVIGMGQRTWMRVVL